jgi:hypothetical protein
MVCSVPEDDERIIPVKRPQDFIVCGRFIQSNLGGKAMWKFGSLKTGKGDKCKGNLGLLKKSMKGIKMNV